MCLDLCEDYIIIILLEVQLKSEIYIQVSNV